MSEIMQTTGETLFQLQVWDYLAWALDDERLEHVDNLCYKGEPISISSFANPHTPVVKCWSMAFDRAGDADSEYPFMVKMGATPFPEYASCEDKRQWVGSQSAYTSSDVWDRFKSLLHPIHPARVERVKSGESWFVKMTLTQLAFMLNSNLLLGGE